MPSRTRTTGEIVSNQRISRNVAWNGTVSETTSYPDEIRTGESKTTTDVVTPGYRQRIERGEIINNPFYSDVLSLTHTYSNSHHQATSGSGSQNKDAYGLPGYGFPSQAIADPTLHDVESLITLAGTEAASKVLQPPLQGLVEVAEFHKTMELFRVRTGYLNRHLDSILRFAERKGKLRKGINFFSENWLKYRYGIMPLVHSADSALRELGRIRAIRQTARGSESTTTSGTNSTVNNSGQYWTLNFTHFHERTTSVRAGILYEFTGKYNEFGFHFSDVPSAAWELIPYSFVADWAVNVGDYIQAVTPKVNARVLASWTTIHASYRRTTSLNAVWKNVAGRIEIVRPSGGSVRDHRTKERIPKVSVGVAFRVNALQKVSAPKRVVDAIALTTQLLKGKRPRGARI